MTNSDYLRFSLSILALIGIVFGITKGIHLLNGSTLEVFGGTATVLASIFIGANLIYRINKE